jgi:type VI secretion system secreted protein VgrG
MSTVLDSTFDLDFGDATTATTWGRTLHGRERMNAPYQLDVTFVADGDDDELEAALLERAVSIRLKNRPRAFHGVVASIALLEAFPGELRGYQIQVVPRLMLLKNRKNNRIFQDMTALDIVSALLKEHDVACELRIVGEYASRAYCVQYRESDYAFVKRLLAEEGLFYCFDHPIPAANGGPLSARETMVISDTVAHYQPIEGAADLTAARYAGMHARENELYDVQAQRRVRPRSALVRGYDFKRPATELRDERLSTSAAEPMVENGSPVEPHLLTKEEQEQMGTLNSQPLADCVVTCGQRTLYEHTGAFEELPATPRAALVRLEQERADVATVTGWSVCSTLLPGRRFTLHEHASDIVNQDYVVVSLEHHAEMPGQSKDRPAYRNHVECAPANVRVRPKRPSRKPRQVVETAVVMAPEGKDLLTDEHGRIRVRFAWDLAPETDDRTSCWIRSMQPWAGSGWGTQFIPRAGMEVLVSFLGGDMDRPVVLGALYNATHPPPFVLPDKQTQSGIRTQTTPDGDGFNELLFDDRKGGELVSIRAQRDLVTTTLNNHRVEVGADLVETVAGKRATKLLGDDELVVTGHQTTTILGGAFTSVKGGGGTSIGGNSDAQIAGNDTTRIQGGQTLVISNFQHVVVGGQPEGSEASFTVNGDYRLGAAKKIQAVAKEGLRFTCGDSSIELLPGEIKITTKKLTLTATEGLSCVGPGNQITMTDHLEMRADELKFYSRNGSFIMDDEAKLDAKQVKLNCDPDRPKPDKKEDGPKETGTIVFKLDPKLEMAPADRFTMRIATPTGEVIEKEADANHEVHIEGEKGDRYTLVEVLKNGQSLSKKSVK